MLFGSSLNHWYSAVAWTGVHYLVVWRRHTTAAQKHLVEAARVNTAGTPLHKLPIKVSTASNYLGTPALAHDGKRAMVVWAAGAYPKVIITGALVDGNGVVTAPQSGAFSYSAGVLGTARLAFNGNMYLTAWDYAPKPSVNNNYDLRYARVSTKGKLLNLSADLTLSASSYNQRGASIACAKSVCLAAWMDKRNGGQPRLYGARISLAGNLLDTSGFLLGGTAAAKTGNQQFGPSVASDGVGFLVAWIDMRAGNRDIYATLVTAGAKVLSAAGVPVCTAKGDQDYPSVAWTGKQYLVVWQDRRGSDEDLYGGRVSATGAALDSTGFAISTAKGAQHLPDVACSGTLSSGCLVTWQDQRSGVGAIYRAVVKP